MKRLKKYWKRITVIALSVVAFLAIAFTYLTWNSHDNNYFLNCRWNAVITEPLARMGNRDAQNKMGYFCLFECGPCEPTAQHLTNAIYWWDKAAEKGDQDAVKQLEWAKVELAKLLSKGQSDSKREAITAKDSNNLTASDASVIDGEISDGVIQMTKAGQLGLFLTNSNLFNATKLAISGTINASDIRTIKTELLALEHLDISATDLKTIERHSFASDGLKTITLPQSVTSIEDSAFYGCSSLASITIPNGVTSIGAGVFYGCSSLTSVTLPNSVTSIEGRTFEGCFSLTSITIPKSVTFIGEGAFSHCFSLTSITLPNSVTFIGEGAFYDCFSLTSVTLPKSIVSIERCAFYRCSSLTSIAIPKSVTSIEYSAFSHCSSLTSITIPRSVTSIGEYAFYGCDKAVFTMASSSPIPYALSMFPYSKEIRVPQFSIDRYKAADGWKDHQIVGY